jgi:hypothetical protein
MDHAFVVRSGIEQCQHCNTRPTWDGARASCPGGGSSSKIAGKIAKEKAIIRQRCLSVAVLETMIALAETALATAEPSLAEDLRRSLDWMQQERRVRLEAAEKAKARSKRARVAL